VAGGRFLRLRGRVGALPAEGDLRLLEEAHVAAVPGDAFGDDRCVRFSFATAIERVREGMRRLAAWAA
jgi:aspartate/methionine/tyrosine aminotransferase